MDSVTRLDLFPLAILIVVPATAAAVCPLPTPKVCNEFFKSDAVVIGTVVAQQDVAAIDRFDDGWIYRIRVHHTFRGPKQGELSVFTENNTGRLPLIVDHEYLLFADLVGDRLEITNCGNSGLAAERTIEIHAIENLTSDATRIEGHVAARPEWVGVRGARFEIIGAGRKYSTVADEGGFFSVEVPPGSYAISAESGGIAAFDLSYDDPKHLTVQRGQCAQVQFVTDQRPGAAVP